MRYYLKLLFVFFAIILFVPSSKAQFDRISVERLNADSGSTNQNGANIIFTNQGQIVAVWGDKRLGNPFYDIFMRTSADGGQTFSDEIKINDLNGYSVTGGEEVVLVVENQAHDLIFCWTDKRNGNNNMDIYGRTRYNDGTFSGVQRINDDQTNFHQYLPYLTRVGQSDSLVAVWQDSRHCQYGCVAIFASMSTNGGLNWNANIRADIQGPNEEPCDCCRPFVVSGNSDPILMSFRNNLNNIRDIYVAGANSEFTTFSIPVRASFGNWYIPACPSTGPVMIQHTSGVWVSAFADGRSEPFKIYSSRSIDGAQSFGDETLVGGDMAQNFPQLLELNDGRLLIAFQENIPTHDGMRIVGSISDDVGLNWGPLFEISDPAVSFKSHVQLAYDGINTLYAVWIDSRNGNNDIYFAVLEDETTGLNEPEQLPKSTLLLNAYPNPFNAQTTIEFTLGAPSDVELTIYDITGAKVMAVELAGLAAGQHAIVWDAGDVASGVYFARIEAGDYSNSIKMVLLK